MAIQACNEAFIEAIRQANITLRSNLITDDLKSATEKARAAFKLAVQAR